jgi:hypothetical protein
MGIRALARLVILFLSVDAAWAQGFSLRNVELSLSEAVSHYTTKDFVIGTPQSSTPLANRMRMETGNRHEVRGNALTTKRFGIEGFYMHQSSNVVFEPAAGDLDSFSIPLHIDHFGANFLYYPFGTADAKKWWPFVQVGGGAMIYRPTEEGQKLATDPLRGNLSTLFESSRAAISVGGGIKRSIGHSLGVRFDIGTIVTKAPTFGLPYDSDLPNTAVLPLNSRTRNMHASAGIIFYLWRSR